MIMEISSLQKARYEYAPKLPGMLRNGIADICVVEGEETQSVADQEKIKELCSQILMVKRKSLSRKEQIHLKQKNRLSVLSFPEDRLQADITLSVVYTMH